MTAQTACARDRARVTLGQLMPALSIATSVPVFIAMPTAASATADGSVMPYRPSRQCDPPTGIAGHFALLSWKDFVDDVVEAQRARDGVGRNAVVPGQRHDAEAVSLISRIAPSVESLMDLRPR